MGREVRMVPPDWKHPKDASGNYIALHDDYIGWLRGKAQWPRGFVSDYRGGWTAKTPVDQTLSWEEYAGDQKPEEYMPCWPPEVCTHFQMYEDTSEGTPISPPMATAEALAQWLVDNDASAFAGQTATYEGWLATIRRGWAFSAECVGGRLMSGVDAMAMGLGLKFEIPPGTRETKCRSCGAAIFWVESKNGKAMPISSDGTSHFSDCPQAAEWRKR